MLGYFLKVDGKETSCANGKGGLMLLIYGKKQHVRMIGYSGNIISTLKRTCFYSQVLFEKPNVMLVIYIVMM